MIVTLGGSPAATSSMPVNRALLPVLALVAALAALAFGATPAGAKADKAPCWKVLQNDEYDGTIDHTYPLHCYRDAIAHLPGDSLIYGRFKNDITRAMLSAIAELKAKGVKVGPNTKLPPESSSRKLQERKRHKGFFATVADKIGPGNASSIPLPLLILAGLGLLLVAAAGASFTARWIAARRSQPHPATSPPTPRRK